MRTRSLTLGISLTVVTSLGCPPPPNPPPDIESADAPQETDTAALPELPQGECGSDPECEVPGIPACQRAACVNAKCELAPREEGLACDDEDLCTSEDRCESGACAGKPISCDDKNACTVDGCDPGHGCVHAYTEKSCDDTNACTVADACFQGKCLGTTLVCDDHNDCTVDSCDKVAGCGFAVADLDCSDGDACTIGDACQGGVCVAGAALPCESGPCKTALCDVSLGCQLTFLEGPCEDADACFEATICVDGECVGSPVLCDDLNSCTTDYCWAASGCSYTPNTLPCDDDDQCTVGDICATGACQAGSLDPQCCNQAAECDDGDPCVVDECPVKGDWFSPKYLGLCTHTAMNCDDGALCTTDGCQGGECQHPPLGKLPAGDRWVENFEGPLGPEWTLTTTQNPGGTKTTCAAQLDSKDKHGGAQSLYFGETETYGYDCNFVGSLRRKVSLWPGSSTLHFWILQDIQETVCSYDVFQVLVDGKLLLQECGDVAQWTEKSLQLDAYAGKDIEIELRFNTVDGVNNLQGYGARIDDLRLHALPPQGCCVADQDCGIGTCDGPLCHPAIRQCQTLAPQTACDDQDPCTADACQGGQCAHPDLEGCCSFAASCPADPEKPCAVPICNENACGLDESGC
jgi:hypothetical protein